MNTGGSKRANRGGTLQDDGGENPGNLKADTKKRHYDNWRMRPEFRNDQLSGKRDNKSR